MHVWQIERPFSEFLATSQPMMMMMSNCPSQDQFCKVFDSLFTNWKCKKQPFVPVIISSYQGVSFLSFSLSEIFDHTFLCFLNTDLNFNMLLWYICFTSCKRSFESMQLSCLLIIHFTLTQACWVLTETGGGWCEDGVALGLNISNKIAVSKPKMDLFMCYHPFVLEIGTSPLVVPVISASAEWVLLNNTIFNGYLIEELRWHKVTEICSLFIIWKKYSNY